jgi:hypothetical protein
MLIVNTDDHITEKVRQEIQRYFSNCSAELQRNQRRNTHEMKNMQDEMTCDCICCGINW